MHGAGHLHSAAHAHGHSAFETVTMISNGAVAVSAAFFAFASDAPSHRVAVDLMAGHFTCIVGLLVLGHQILRGKTLSRSH